MDDGTPLAYSVYSFASDDVEPAPHANAEGDEGTAANHDSEPAPGAGASSGTAPAPSAEPLGIDESANPVTTPSFDSNTSGDAFGPETEPATEADPSTLASMAIPTANTHLAATGENTSDDSLGIESVPEAEAEPEPISAQTDAQEGFGYLSYKSGQAAVELPTPSVLALGAQGSIRPSSDVVLFENVLGDPRIKVVEASFDFEQIPNKSVHLHAVLSLRSLRGIRPHRTAHAVDVVIPEDWSGEKKVLFVAHDGVKANESTLAVEAEAEELVEESFAVEPGEYRVVQVRTAPDDVQNPNQRYMETLVVEPADASDTLSPVPTSVTNGGAAAPSISSSTTSAMAPTPRTGDDSASGALAAGLAAFGAAALAYERRREG